MLVTLFRLLSTLPLFFLHAIGTLGGWLVYLASASYRGKLKDNLFRAGYPAALPQAISESGKSMFELPFIWCAAPQRVLRTATIENWELAQAALDAKTGVIFLTPHLGCFEIIAQAIATKTPLTALYRPPRKAALKPLIEGARGRHNLLLAPANLAGVRTLFKALKKGQAIGLLPDQVPQNGEGIWADFFVPFDETPGHTPEQRTLAINLAMEKLIARCPAQYIWSYNRYKTPPGVEAPPAVSNPAAPEQQA